MDPVARVAALDQPLRRDLYRLLVERDGWVTRDEASEALGVARSVVAFHLDKLAEAGVVDVRFERTGGRSGPGAGRPSKMYRPSAPEVSASVPERRYDLAGSLLATAIDHAEQVGAPVGEALSATARSAGRAIGEEAAASATSVTDALARCGYEPTVGANGEIALVNCPFHRLAEEHRDLVCGMNLDFLGGLIDGVHPDIRLAARLAPEPGYCCVRITAA